MRPAQTESVPLFTLFLNDRIADYPFALDLDKNISSLCERVARSKRISYNNHLVIARAGFSAITVTSRSDRAETPVLGPQHRPGHAAGRASSASSLNHRK